MTIVLTFSSIYKFRIKQHMEIHKKFTSGIYMNIFHIYKYASDDSHVFGFNIETLYSEYIKWKLIQ